MDENNRELINEMDQLQRPQERLDTAGAYGWSEYTLRWLSTWPVVSNPCSLSRTQQSNMASCHTYDADTYMDGKRSELTHGTARHELSQSIILHHPRMSFLPHLLPRKSVHGISVVTSCVRYDDQCSWGIPLIYIQSSQIGEGGSI